MKAKFFCVFSLIVSVGTQTVFAQANQRGFQARTTASPVRTVAAEVPAVSQDLLQIYENTKLVRTEDHVTSIVNGCRSVLSERGRSKLDRDYALSLLAWALNRRGEMRSDRASELVQQDKLSQADQLDRQAAEDFESAVKFAPDNWRTHHNFAISLAMKGNYQRAVAELSRAIELKPDYANAHFNRGELHFEIEDYENAEKDYSTAISLNTQDPQYFNSRAHCRFMLERYGDALKDYQQAAESDRTNAAFHTDLADAFQYLGMWKDAAQAYQDAVAADNQFARAYQNAAWLMATCPEESLRNPQLSLAAAKKAIELSEPTSRGLDTLAAATAVSGDRSEAARIQQQAIALAEDDREKQEFNQRLSMYRRGSVYLQPKPLSGIAATTTPDTQPIRTASGGQGSNR